MYYNFALNILLAWYLGNWLKFFKLATNKVKKEVI